MEFSPVREEDKEVISRYMWLADSRSCDMSFAQVYLWAGFYLAEYTICEFLALNHGQVFSKERILEHVFGFDGDSNSSAITEHVKNIRAKFQKFGINPIETVWGIGYRWK